MQNNLWKRGNNLEKRTTWGKNLERRTCERKGNNLGRKGSNTTLERRSLKIKFDNVPKNRSLRPVSVRNYTVVFTL